ncbi:MAG: DinB family protein [Chitinophagaceae bacterium]|nr:DinB family protein [Chitinophagaceae bacterium]
MDKTEYWLRGPVPEVPALLQPVAHALLQSVMEVRDALKDFPTERLWDQPAGLASVAFHLQHLKGVTNRLLTYARGEQLSPEQLDLLKMEGTKINNLTVDALIDAYEREVDNALGQVKTFNEADLLSPRAVGRKMIPSNVLGLLFHAAEHAQRHTGQLLVTAKVAMHAINV